jgi:uncharacterized membrane protein YgcG
MASDDGGDTDVRRLVFAAFAVLTVVGVVLSVVLVDDASAIPPRIYVFGFLGATVYVFTSLAEKFDEEDRYALEIASKGIAAFPLAAGVYLLAFAFPATNGDAASQPADRIISGLVFLSGAYVSLTLRALGGLAKRMLGVSEEEETEEKPGEGGADEPENGGTGENGQREPTEGDGTERGDEGDGTETGDEGDGTQTGDGGGGTGTGDGGGTDAGGGSGGATGGSEGVESDPRDAGDGTG